MTPPSTAGDRPQAARPRPRLPLHRPGALRRGAEKIFYRTWVWVAHESECPSRGTFKTTYVGAPAGDRDPRPQGRRQRAAQPLPPPRRHRLREARRARPTASPARTTAGPTPSTARCAASRTRTATRESWTSPNCRCARLRTESYVGMIFATLQRRHRAARGLPRRRQALDGPVHEAGRRLPDQGAGRAPVHASRATGRSSSRTPPTATTSRSCTSRWMASVDDETAEHDVVHDRARGARRLPRQRPQRDGDGPGARPTSTPTTAPRRCSRASTALVAELGEAGHRRRRRSAGSSARCTAPGFNLNLFPNVAMSMSFFRVLRPIAVDRTEVQHIGHRPWTAARIVGPTASGCASTSTSRARSGSARPTTPRAGSGCSAARRPSRRPVPIMVNRGLARENAAARGLVLRTSPTRPGCARAYAQWKKMMMTAW